MDQELEVAVAAARAAGRRIAKHYRGDYQVEEKAPGNPVTIADTEANQIIQKAVLAAFPNDGWLSEETADSPARLAKDRVWIVDPLDGTREFVDHVPEFCVCVALVVAGVVQVGVSYNPIEDQMFAARRGGGTTLNGQPVSCTTPAKRTEAVVLSSRSETKRGEWEAFRPHLNVEPMGSVAYKFALVAAGRADATFSLSPKNEWDICAGTLLVEEAGGVVTDRFGKPITFNNADTLLPGLIAAGPILFGPLRDLIRDVSGL